MMNTVHVTDSTGKYIGSYEGTKLPKTMPKGSKIVQVPPPDSDATWNGVTWVAGVLSLNPGDYILTPRQFTLMASLAGYDDAIDAILAALKAQNINLYAEIKAGATRSASFHFDKVLAIIANPAVAPIIPKSVDVTKATLTKNWLAAKDY